MIRFVAASLLVLLTFLTITSHAQQLYGRTDQYGAAGNAYQQGPPQDNVIIILDASDSMNERISGSNESKFEAAKRVILETLRTMPPNVNVGLRVYGHKLGSGFRVSGFGFMTGGEMCHQSELLVPLATNNRAQIASQLVNIHAVGKTPITYSLEQAVNQDFFGHPGKKTIILVSDGRETCSYNPCDVAVDMVRHGVDVRINTIGLATHDRVADDQLKCIALSTKGKFYSVDTAAQLAKSLQDSSQIYTDVQAKIYPGN